MQSSEGNIFYKRLSAIINNNIDFLLSIKITHSCRVQGYICNSYTMGMGGLPDIYTKSPRAAGPRAEGVHIR